MTEEQLAEIEQYNEKNGSWRAGAKYVKYVRDLLAEVRRLKDVRPVLGETTTDAQ